MSLQLIIEKTAILSWSWYHYIFLYAVIPITILIIPLLNLENIFILDICHQTIPSLYLNNFYHQTLPHLSGNLSFYFLSLTGILFLETDKKRFHRMLVLFFIIFPIIGSLLNIGFLGNICTVKDSLTTYGFSMIALGFTGYFIYLLLLSSIPDLFSGVEKEQKKTSIIRSSLVPFYIVSINFIIITLVLIIGVVAGSFSPAGSTLLNNGFMHAIGFVSGIFFPMIFELKKVNELDYFHMTFLFSFEALIFFLTLYQASVYFTWIV